MVNKNNNYVMYVFYFAAAVLRIKNENTNHHHLNPSLIYNVIVICIYIRVVNAPRLNKTLQRTSIKQNIILVPAKDIMKPNTQATLEYVIQNDIIKLFDLCACVFF